MNDEEFIRYLHSLRPRPCERIIDHSLGVKTSISPTWRAVAAVFAVAMVSGFVWAIFDMSIPLTVSQANRVEVRVHSSELHVSDFSISNYRQYLHQSYEKFDGLLAEQNSMILHTFKEMSDE